MANDYESTGVLTVDSAGWVSWWSTTVPVWAAVELSVGRGVAIEVDAAEPTTVLSWACRPDADISVLGSVFVDAELPARIEQLRSSGNMFAEEAPPRLSDAWARLALVSTASRWLMSPVHEGALMLDEASSHQLAGNTSAAARLFALAAPSLIALGEDCAEGFYADFVSAEVRAVLNVAGDAMAGSALGNQALELAIRLGEPTAISDGDIASLLDAWDLATAVSTGELALTHGLGAADNSASDLQIDTAFIDPRLIPPRILAWHGAHDPDLLIQYKQHDDVAIVSASLADGVDPWALEANQMLAYSLTADTGKLQYCIPMVPQGRVLTAPVPCNGLDPDDLQFGILYAGTDLDTLRTGKVGRDLIEIDRIMVDAWNHERISLAPLSTVSAHSDAAAIAEAQRIHRGRIRKAADLASDAESKLRRLLDRLEDVDSRAERLQAQLQSVGQYRDRLSSTAGEQPNQNQPLLAELLAPEVRDTDEN
ncbi:MAG: hypothetical protein V7697_28925 [Rhodococcus erythropolis]